MKKILKKLTLLGTALVMTTMLLAGCNPASSSKSDTDRKVNSNSKLNTDSVSAAAGNTSQDQASYFNSKKPYTIKIMMFGTATSAAVKEVESALSKITEEKLNADVEITMVSISSYVQQLNIMLASNDKFDLFVPFSSGLDMANAGQIQPIGDLLKTYGKNMLKTIRKEDWEGTTYNNQIYGVPVNTEKAEQLGFGMRKDICDKLGIDYKNMSTLDQIHDSLVKVKKAYPNMYPVVSDSGNMFASLAWIGQDEAGDSYHLTVAKDPYANQLKIVSFFKTDLFKERVNMLYKWAKEGLIMPDASTNTESSGSLVSSGKAFGYFQHMKPGWEKDQSMACGKEIVSVRYGKPVATSTAVTWFVPTSSGDPERAVALLDLMYSDADVSNLVVNGIEGKHYKVIDKVKGVAGYPDGVTSTNVTYARNSWAWPNPQIAYLWEGQDTNIWDQIQKFNNSALMPTDHGFQFSSANVTNEITACTNIYNKYVPALYAGSLNPETTIPQLNSEMEKNGINDIITEKQKQIDEWLKNKN